MISFTQAIILGLIQGITELFPISSLGHSVLLPGLLGWHIDQNADAFLTFLVATHFATSLVLFFVYRDDWRRTVKAVLQSLAEREITTSDALLGWFIVVGTIPAAIAGVLFEKQIQALFIAPVFAALFLFINGIMLFGAERLRKRAQTNSSPHNFTPAKKNHDVSFLETNSLETDRRIVQELSWWKAVKIGCLQIIALIPGFSRTGSTLAGGLLVGLSREEALRFSFLLATPIIFAAAMVKLPPLLVSGNSETIGIAFVGAIAAAFAAYLSVKFLVQYVKTNTLTPFAIYCIILGTIGLLILR